MKFLAMVFSFLVLMTLASAQSKTTVNDTTAKKPEVFTSVDKSAEFPGGMASFYRYLQGNLSYPKTAKKKRIAGKVFVEFVIDKDGSIDKESVRVISIDELKKEGMNKDVITDAEYQQEAVRLIKESPNWSPAMQKEKPVKQRYSLPVLFKP